jgi:hypothetical protein
MKAKLQRAVGRFVPASVVAAAVPWAFPRTHRFLKSDLRPPATPAPNIVHLTCNKAASQNTAKIIARLLGEQGYRTVWPNRYAFFGDSPYFEDLSPAELARNRNVRAPKRVFVAAVARPFEVAEVLAATRQILTVRDPRDILTSDYFSIRYFHPAPSAADKTAEFHAKRADATARGLDGYVLEEAPRLRATFERYAAIGRRDTCLAVLRYEEFIEDFPSWLAALERALGLPHDPGRAGRLGALAPQRPTAEQRDRKIRSGRTGQFRDKLAPATIAALDAEFAPVLEAFGYAPVTPATPAEVSG